MIGSIERVRQAVRAEKNARLHRIGARFAISVRRTVGDGIIGSGSEHIAGFGVEFVGSGSTCVSDEPIVRMVRLYGQETIDHNSEALVKSEDAGGWQRARQGVNES